MTDNALESALDELYTAAPDAFLAARSTLSAEAREAGDADGARMIGAQRKPTLAAWIVNAYVLEHRDVADRLTRLGDTMRVAHQNLDADALRPLSEQRTALVNELCTTAVRQVPRRVSATVWDEVRDTFAAAIADPRVTARLGRLTRAESYSGFGSHFESEGRPPQLTVLPGGRDEPDTEPSAVTPPKRWSATERRKLQRLLERAEHDYDVAVAALNDWVEEEKSARAAIDGYEKAIADLRLRMEDARDDLAKARVHLTPARDKLRQARRALDKARRASDGAGER